MVTNTFTLRGLLQIHLSRKSIASQFRLIIQHHSTFRNRNLNQCSRRVPRKLYKTCLTFGSAVNNNSWLSSAVFSHVWKQLTRCCLIIRLFKKLKRGTLVSPCPSVCSSVRLWTESCPLCMFYNTWWIPFMFTHRVKQLQRCVTCITSFNLEKNSIGKFFEFVTLTLSCFEFGSNMTWSIVWVIIGRQGYPQNAAV